MTTEKKGQDTLLDNLSMAVAKRRSEKQGKRRYGSEHYKVKAQGLNDEMTVANYLTELGYDVYHCEDLDSQLSDIDIYMDGKPVSIKAQHEGYRYDNIYVELATQKDTRYGWRSLDVFSWVKSAALRSSKPVFIDQEHWNPGWWITGEADLYLIWQEKRLRLYSKYDIEDYLKANGFAKDKSGSHKVYGLKLANKRREGGKDTICGYLPVKEVPFLQEWDLAVEPERRSKYKINPL